MEDLKNVTDHYKGRIFDVRSAIGEGQIRHRAQVLQSYNYLCFCEVQKAFISGIFKEFIIGKIGMTSDNEETISPLLFDYEKTPNMPPRYAAPEAEVKARYDKMVDEAKLKFFETELKESRQKREVEAREKADTLKRETFFYIKNRLLLIDQELKTLINGNDIKKMVSDKKIVALVNESATLEKLTLILKMR